VERHPHIYGDVVADDAEAVKRNWEKIKLATGKAKKKTVLSGVPTALPAMVKAMRMQEKTAQFGLSSARPPMNATRRKNLVIFSLA